jgi:hypothetical protein
MPQSDVLAQVVQTLDHLGIEYMVTGSIASSLQGEPRSTHDIDLVVAIHLSDIPQLVQAFPPPDFYLDEEMIREAIQQTGMFNLLDVTHGDKVDFWLLSRDPFDISRFERRYPEHCMGTTFYVSRPEDTIIMKLRWAQMSGGSEKQFGDALRVYEVQFETIDIAYIEHWIHQLGLESLWHQLLEVAEPL